MLIVHFCLGKYSFSFDTFFNTLIICLAQVKWEEIKEDYIILIFKNENFK